MKRRGTRLAVFLGVVVALGAIDARSQPTIAHATRRDSVARLLERIAAGEVVLTGSDNEILRTVLRELHVPLESQLTVFSRTSMQAGLIGPKNPRALYFSDSTYVGWVPGGLMEVVAIDPEAGPIFYAFDPQDARDKRRTLVRETSCLRCHGGSAMEKNPVLFAQSVFATDQGEPLREHGSELVTEQTPFERRWGGWYVTGYEGTQNHRGNAFTRERDGKLESSLSERRPSALGEFFETSRYLAATSDIVALLVFEHQLAMQNSLLRAAQAIRRVPSAQISPDQTASADSVLTSAAEDVIDHLLFRNAAPLPDGIKGSESFQRAFATGALRSAKGNALKDFSLRDRLFANRCSFLIYSELFAALPAPLKTRVLDRLAAVLRDDDPPGRYAYLEKDEKRRILEILTATLPAFAPPLPSAAR